jgi:hypothetical protein
MKQGKIEVTQIYVLFHASDSVQTLLSYQVVLLYDIGASRSVCATLLYRGEDFLRGIKW